MSNSQPPSSPSAAPTIAIPEKPPWPWRNPHLYDLVTAIRRQDPAINRHGRRVQRLALFLGTELRLPQHDLSLLSPAALLHDIGKAVIAPSILHKQAPLTRREWTIIKEHPVTSADLCDAHPELRPARSLIEGHHEHLDGSGYPHALSGSAIPITTQVLQIADIVDAITSSRSYKPSYPLTHAFSVLTAEAERGWRDPSLIRQCVRILTPAHHPSRHPDHPFHCRTMTDELRGIPALSHHHAHGNAHAGDYALASCTP